jgi:hypothetical protein
LEFVRDRRNLMLKSVNIERCSGKFTRTFSPKIVGDVNGQHVRLLLFEPSGIAHTGSVRAEITGDAYDLLDES